MTAAGGDTDTGTVAIDASAVIARLLEVDLRSGGDRVAWTDCWAAERKRQVELVRQLVPDVLVEVDAFANHWYVLPGASRETVLVGSHSDCVPGGGWLDGILGVHAGIGLLAALAPVRGDLARTVAVVDWADEEGASFGRSLLGSAAAAGQLTREELEALEDAAAALAAHGFDPAALGRRSPRLREVVAAVEVHIEQGPVLEAEGRAVAAVSGCLGVRRLRIAVDGAAGHAGATPMPLRRDPVRAVARAVAEIAELAEAAGGLATVGVLQSEPAIPTAIAAHCAFTLDLRHADAGALDRLEHEALSRVRVRATDNGCTTSIDTLWSIEPVAFDTDLTERAALAAGGGPTLISGPLHDSATLAQAGIPTTMLFAPSIGGVSHSRAEDTAEAGLVTALETFSDLVVDLALVRR